MEAVRFVRGTVDGLFCWLLCFGHFDALSSVAPVQADRQLRVPKAKAAVEAERKRRVSEVQSMQEVRSILCGGCVVYD